MASTGQASTQRPQRMQSAWLIQISLVCSVFFARQKPTIRSWLSKISDETLTMQSGLGLALMHQSQ